MKNHKFDPMKPLFTLLLVVFSLTAQSQFKSKAKEARLNQERFEKGDCAAITDAKLRLKCIQQKTTDKEVATPERSDKPDTTNRRQLVKKATRNVAPEPTFYSAYGTGYKGLAEVESHTSNRFLTPITYVDFNHVYDRLNEYVSHELNWLELEDPELTGDSFVSRYDSPGGEVTMTYSVGSYNGRYFVTDLKATGAYTDLARFFLTYWTHNFNERNVRQGELAVYTYMLDRIAFDEDGIHVTNPTITSESEFINQIKGNDE